MLALEIVWASGASAQNPDPLHIGSSNTPAALEGSYITTDGRLQWLMLGSPQTDLSLHIQFYTAACNEVTDKSLKLTENQVAALPLHSPSTTRNRVGNFLVSGPGLELTDAAVIGQTFFVDVNRGIARLEELARLAGDGATGWSPYQPAHVLLFAPPDDGVTATATLLVRCPVGVTRVTTEGKTDIVGTPGTLGGDMLALAATAQGGLPDATTLCAKCDTNGLFATAMAANVYDLDENLLQSTDSIPCRCLGVDPTRSGTGFVTEARLSELAPLAGLGPTYWEIFSVGGAAGEELFTASQNIQVRFGGLNLNFYGRLHNAGDTGNIR